MNDPKSSANRASESASESASERIDSTDLSLAEGRLIAWAQGRLEPSDTEALAQEVGADPALAAEAASWRRLMEAEKGVWSGELAAATASSARVAAQVRLRAGASDVGAVAAVDRADLGWRTAPGGRRASRVLAISIGLHVAALALLALVVARDTGTPADPRAEMAARFSESDDAGLPDADSALAELFQDAVKSSPIEVPDSVLLSGADAELDDADPWRESLEHTTHAQPLEHPRDVAIPMWIRRNETLKARRLSLLGVEADGTLRAVRRGLRWLSLRQHIDGSFPAPEGTSRVAQTAMALLPFLGDGFDASRVAEGAHAREIGVVRRGVAWVRTQAFAEDGRVRDLDPATLGVVAMALSEDYMLGYGRLRIAQAQRRAREIGRLSDALRANVESSESTSGGTPWALWGLEATARRGLVPAQAGDEARFQAWVASASRQDGDALAMGTAVLLGDASVDKAGFRAWSRDRGTSLLDTLLPNGRSRSESDDVRAVGETARRLLALQIAYRTY